MTRRGAATLALLLALIVGVPASAHEGDPTVWPRIEAVEPEIAGLTVQVVASVTAQLVMANETSRVLEVLDVDGRPFLRLGPDGVEGDLASAAFIASNDPFGGGGDGSRGGGEPRWARLSAEPSWGWFDHRLHAPDSAAGDEWTIELRLGDEPVVVRGELARRTVSGVVQPVLAGGQQAVSPFTDVLVQLLPGILPGLFLRNDGPSPVLVRGADGEPFLRIGPDGAEANVRSPSWAASVQAEGQQPSVADARAEPEWQLVSEQPALAWLERRGLYPEPDPPPAVVAAGTPAVLLEWSVPIERDGQLASIDGQTVWHPVAAVPGTDEDHDDGSPLGWRLALAGVAAGAAGWVVGTARGRRRRARSTTGP
jgi:hypothetical protein